MRNRPLGGVHVASAIRAGASAAEWVVYAPRWVHCGTQTPRRAHNEHPLHSVVARRSRASNGDFIFLWHFLWADVANGAPRFNKSNCRRVVLMSAK